MPAASSSGRKLNAFISYSRQDTAFVDRLQAALAEHDIQAFVDREAIEKGEAWWARITQLITEADTIVFALSPGSVDSKVCKDEVEFAERLNKRFVPIVARDLEGRAVPAALARLNYIFFIPDPAAGANGDFEAAVGDLVRALETDIPWIREHTRLGALAQRWETRKRPGDLLLRGAELNAAETWLTTRPEKAPDPTDAHRALVTLSRRAATRRRNTLTAGFTVGLLVAVGLAGIAYVQVQTRIAERDAGLITQSNRLADAAYQQISSGDAATGLLLALEGLPSGEPGDERKFVRVTENMVLAGLLNLRERDVIDVRGGAVVSPDGTRVAYGTGDDRVRIVDIKTKALIIEFAYDGLPESLSFSPDGKRLVTLSNSSKIQIWDVRTGRALITLTNDNRFGSVTFSPDGNKLIFTNGPGRGRHAATKGGEINQGAMVFDMTTLRRTALISHPAKVFRAVMSEDGRIIATAAEDKRVRIFDAIAGRVLHQLPEHPKGILDIALSRDGAYVVSGSEDGTARLWRTDTGALVHKFVSQARDWFWAVGISADGEQVLTNTGTEVTAWSIETGRQLWSVKAHVKPLPEQDTETEAGFALDRAEGTLVTAHVDSSLRIWDIATKPADVISIGCASALYLKASRDTNVIATYCFESGNVQVWDTASQPRQLLALKASDADQSSIELAADGATLALDTPKVGVQLVATRTGQTLLSEPYASELSRIAFSPRGDRFALGLDDGQIRIWTRSNNTWQTAPLVIATGGSHLYCLAFSALGDRLLSMSANGTPRIWNAENGAQIAQLTIAGEKARVEAGSEWPACAYAPDGKTIAIDIAGRLQIWDALTYKRESFTQQSHGNATLLDYTPDSTRLMRPGGSTGELRMIEVPSGRYTPSADGTDIGRLAFDPQSAVIAITAQGKIRLVDQQTQRTLKDFDADPGDIHLSVSAGRLVGAMQDGNVAIWPIRHGSGLDRIQAARRAVPRCLTYLQRREANLPPLPPRWCITGADQVASKDPALWAGKWPYHTKEWRDWLAARDRGENPDTPDRYEYSQKVEPNRQ